MNILLTCVGSGVSESVLKSLRKSMISTTINIIGTCADTYEEGVYLSDKFYKIPSINEKDKYISSLLEICEKENIDLIIPGIDLELEMLSVEKSRFKCPIVVSSPLICQIALDKYLCSQYFTKHNLPFVETYLLSDAKKQKELNFPLISKPITGNASHGIHLISSLEELVSLTYPKDSDNMYIVQTYLSNEENPNKIIQKDELSVQYYVSKDGYILGKFMSINRLKNGIPIQVVPFNNKNVEMVCNNVVNVLVKDGLVGPINIQGKLINEEFIIFEINARYTGITDIRNSMGYKEVDAVIYDYILNKPLQQIQNLFNTNYNYIGIRSKNHLLIPNKIDDNKSVKSILITGANGLVGKHLIKQLTQPNVKQIVAGVRNSFRTEELKSYLLNNNIDLSKVKFSTADLSYKTWDCTGIDIVIHGASIRINNSYTVSDYDKINVEGTRLLLNEAKRCNVKKFIYLSTHAVYGEKIDTDKLWSERDKINPCTIYGFSRKISEIICKSYIDYFDIIILRITSVFDDNGMSPTIIHKFIDTINNSKSDYSEIKIYGSGNQTVDYIYIDDLTCILSKILDYNSPNNYEIFNIGSGHPDSLMNISLAIKEKFNKRNKTVTIINLNTDQYPSYGVNINKINNTFNWTPQYNIKDMITNLHLD